MGEERSKIEGDGGKKGCYHLLTREKTQAGERGEGVCLKVKGGVEGLQNRKECGGNGSYRKMTKDEYRGEEGTDKQQGHRYTDRSPMSSQKGVHGD